MSSAILDQAVFHATTEPGRRGIAPAGVTRVALVGAGYIADYHIAALRELGSVEVVGACDPNRARLGALRDRWAIPYGSGSLVELIRDRKPDAVHILVPPPLHREVAEQSLEAGVHVLLEKPMALRAAECDRLIELARSRGLHLGVNHNAMHHPLYRRLLRDIADRKLGDIQHVVSFNNLSLAQLEAGDHDHWMFRSPENVLFEQGPHPLSQVCGLLGEVRHVTTIRSGERRLRTGAPFWESWLMSMSCEVGTAQLFLCFGRPFAEAWLHVIGQDGSARVDLINDVYVLDRRTKYLEPVDRFLRGLGRVRQGARCSLRRMSAYGLSTLRLTGRSDSYYLSMRDGIAAFHASLAGKGPGDGSSLSGRMVIDGLERAAASLAGPGVVGTSPPAPAGGIVSATSPVSPGIRGTGPGGGGRSEGEILVLGGTGFIGRRLVPALIEAGHAVRLMVRRPALVPAEVTQCGGLSVVAGDVRNAADVLRATEGCRAVIHLVAGAPATWAEFEALFIEGTRHAAEACLRWDVPQLLYASSIAAYYLGSRGETITEATPPDPYPERRNLYTRAKIACEKLLMELHRSRGLPVTIFRPGVVVGDGGPLEHLGVGYWPAPSHCIAWGRGTEPIPFVLVDDVTSAFVAALSRPGLEGKSFNLVGDVRLTAVEYVIALRNCSRRDVRLHRQPIAKWMAVDLAKWAVKAVARKPENEYPSYRDLASRSSASQFDCSAAKRELGWNPVDDRDRFVEMGIRRALAGAGNG